MEGEIIRLLEATDTQVIASAFADIGWTKPVSQFEGYLSDQQRGERVVLVASNSEGFAGYVTILWQSDYAPFREAGIPEIVDLNVLPRQRKRGIGSRLLDGAEQRIAERSRVAGIAVGLYREYGAAQRLYVTRGYIPDGEGLIAHHRPVAPGETVRVDDGLVLCLTRTLLP